MVNTIYLYSWYLYSLRPSPPAPESLLTVTAQSKGAVERFEIHCEYITKDEYLFNKGLMNTSYEWFRTWVNKFYSRFTSAASPRSRHRNAQTTWFAAKQVETLKNRPVMFFLYYHFNHIKHVQQDIDLNIYVNIHTAFNYALPSVARRPQFTLAPADSTGYPP